jgi:FlaA1/EpsC-like NDP-sugar epimerase
VEWLWFEWPKLLVNAFFGSSLVVLGTAALDYRGIARGDMALDLVLYSVLATLCGVYWNRTSAGWRGTAQTGSTSGGLARRRWLIVGEGVHRGPYLQVLALAPQESYEIAGLVTPDRDDRTSTIGGHPVIGEIAELPAILEALSIDRLVVIASSLPQAAQWQAQEAAARCSVTCVTVDLGLALLTGTLGQRSEHPGENRTEAEGS